MNISYNATIKQLFDLIPMWRMARIEGNRHAFTSPMFSLQDVAALLCCRGEMFNLLIVNRYSKKQPNVSISSSSFSHHLLTLGHYN